MTSLRKTFRPSELNQRVLLPPDLREWLPEDHVALFVSEVVDALDLSAIFSVYEQGDGRGQPPYDPVLMVKLLVYAYCTGKPSARKIERATYEEVAYRVLAADQQPDHASIADFRKRHLQALAGLFLHVLRLCQAAGLVQLGHVALAGTKVQANASKPKALSYERMAGAAQKLEEEGKRLLEQAEAADAVEDARYGHGQRGEELPAELTRRESRLHKIREAKAALEQKAKEPAQQAAAAAQAKIAERQRREAETGQKAKGRVPVVPDPEQAKPDPKAQRNFTDPDSRIMKDGATKAFAQAYNAQVAVDSQAQIIVAAAVTQEANDKAQLVPMRHKLRTPAGQAVYKLRKAIVEPVFGQIKEVRGFRRFSFRGLVQVAAEWTVICLTHKLLKLFRAGAGPRVT